MAETPLTIGEVITRLQACDPAAYLCLDDNGLPLPVVDIAACADGGHPYVGQLHDGRVVDVVYLTMRGDDERHAHLLEAMEEWLAASEALAGNIAAIGEWVATGEARPPRSRAIK